MNSTELAAIFSKRYHEAVDKETVVSINIFGIEFAECLAGQNLQDICARAEVPKSYATEIRKGIRLSKFVELKK